jgi:ectoine hydroxylase
MTEAGAGQYELTREELAAFERDGFVLRRDVFAPAEIADMIREGEDLLADLVRDRVGHRMKVGSYVFDPDLLRGVLIKWEGDSDVVHGIEPFAHLSPVLEHWGRDDRLVQPMRAIIGHPELDLFTEKLNLKRARHGGPNPLHQDYPYWRDSAEDPLQVATTIVYLDDADADNGCTWVVPGSHREGIWQTRTDSDVFGQNEIDSAAYPDAQPVPVEVAAGSTISFGPLLVHQSTPNASDRERRALLYSYQPSGRPHLFAQFRRRDS